MRTGSDRHPTWELYYAAERDVRSALAHLSHLGIALANLNLPAPTEIDCPVCGLKAKGPRTLAEHIYVNHEGEVPSLSEEAEAPSS